MKNVTHNQKGFTLLEIIVVLAVLGALASMLAPVVFRYIDDANRTRAQADANAMAAAIQQMYKDTGRWAFYASGTSKLTLTAGTDATLLTSNSACDPGDIDLATCDDSEPVAGTGWTFTGKADYIGRQLITNAPAYATTGGRAWKGPYLDAIPALDPWGRSYLVNILNANPDEEGSTQKWVVVLSAGPDGNIDTAGNTAGTANPAVAGDDVIARVK